MNSRYALLLPVVGATLIAWFLLKPSEQVERTKQNERQQVSAADSVDLYQVELYLLGWIGIPSGQFRERGGSEVGQGSVDAAMNALAYALDLVLGERGRGVEDGNGVGAIGGVDAVEQWIGIPSGPFRECGGKPGGAREAPFGCQLPTIRPILAPTLHLASPALPKLPAWNSYPPRSASKKTRR